MNTSIWWVAVAFALVVAGSICLARASRRTDEGSNGTRGAAIKYTAHARQRMIERGILAAQVEGVLANPARRVRDHLENSVRLEGDYEDRVLKVWVAEPWPATGVAIIKSTAWKHLTTLSIPAGQVGRVIGRNGAVIERLRCETGAQILVNQDGTIRISAGDVATLESARQRIVAMTTQPKPSQAPTDRPRGGENMSKSNHHGNAGKSGSGSVSSARLHQKSGTSNAFGGYTKVAKTDGTFRMRKSGN